MDATLVPDLVAWWWTVPAVIGAGALAWFGLRGQRSGRARRLAYDASREAVRAAQREVATTRMSLRVARAELARTLAERSAGRADGADVARARRAVDLSQRDGKAAAATLRARRAALSADRAAVPGRSSDPRELPLARVMASDDAVTARWMEYETDAAKVIAFPAMADATVPETAAFLSQLRTTRALRPATATAPMSPAEFTAYRDAVARLAHAYDRAEAEAWRRARREGSAPAGPGPDTAQPSDWMLSAQEIAQNLTEAMIARGAEAFAQGAEAIARLSTPRDRRRDERDPRGDRDRRA